MEPTPTFEMFHIVYFLKSIFNHPGARRPKLKGKKKFLKSDGSFYEPGDIYIQPDLAETLKRIAQGGTKGFYEGKTAELIVAEMQKGNGLITLDDLKAMRPPIFR